MQRRALAEDLLRKGRVHRHRADCQIAYDDRRTLPAHVVDTVKRYDPNLYFRYNLISTCWELWRWRREVFPSAAGMTPEGIVERSVFVWTIRTMEGLPMEPYAARVLEYLAACDEFKRGRYTADQTADKLDDVSMQQIRKDKADRAQFVDDWKRDNRQQIRSLKGLQRSYSIPK